MNVFSMLCLLSFLPYFPQDFNFSYPYGSHPFGQVSGISEALGPLIEPLLAGSPLGPLVAQCCQDSEATVRQSAFALVGDLAQSSPSVLQPVLPIIVTVALQLLEPRMVHEVRRALFRRNPSLLA